MLDISPIKATIYTSQKYEKRQFCWKIGPAPPPNPYPRQSSLPTLSPLTGRFTDGQFTGCRSPRTRSLFTQTERSKMDVLSSFF